MPQLYMFRGLQCVGGPHRVSLNVCGLEVFEPPWSPGLGPLQVPRRVLEGSGNRVIVNMPEKVCKGPARAKGSLGRDTRRF